MNEKKKMAKLASQKIFEMLNTDVSLKYEYINLHGQNKEFTLKLVSEKLE